MPTKTNGLIPANGAVVAVRDVMGRVNWKSLGPLFGLIALVVIGLLVNPRFIATRNLMNIFTRSAFIGIIAIGTTFVLTAGGLDLSVGSMAAFASGITIIAINSTAGILGTGFTSIFVGMVAALLVGLLAGLFNGFVITRGRIEPFIVTLGTMGIFRALIIYLADGGTLTLESVLRQAYRPVYYASFLGIPLPIWIFAVAALLGALVLNKTRFGRYCFAIGSNEEVAAYSAVKVNRIKMLTYVLQGLCVGLATLIYVPRLGSASGTTGLMWELEAIAAAIIGGTLLKGGYGRIWGTIVGAIMLSMIGNILNLTDAISSYLNQAVQGVLIIVAVLLQRGSEQE